ncbi:hypothetical protein DICPUDRAFT_88405 [Dictyostelium purpureum]|uniref:Mevalonate kinase n=1 Tax=Dictyostelium purpureum TaxID=5786 RepID=F0ZP71_DICPU|nr:uncharacterized protein DICPUDRAFT_88405 [Dictyostelium purpureum]EGC34243.1 hypothetical protein DICPUDRAFT_88405 [Dictyostelium purpureum]|eukprot:XP_003289212.1 hypothetical protein DICPUDRAFT_88405 [Dictyostelium purpureum]
MISNDNNTIQVSAPGKIILFGEHAVVLEKTAIAASLSLRTTVTFTPNDKNRLLLDLPDIPDFGIKEWSLDDFKKLGHFPTDIDPLKPIECNQDFAKELTNFIDIKGIHTFLFLFCTLTKCNKAMDIRFSSALPIGAGLGSSASFCVGICAGLLKALDIYACGGCEQCKSTSEGQPCNQQLNLINQWSLQGEKIMHGTPSGIDNAVSTFGKALTFTRKNGYSVIENGIPPLRILITNTKVSRSTKTLVEGVINRSKQFPTLIDPVSNLIDTISKQCITVFDQYHQDKDYDRLQTAMDLMFDMNQHLLSGCYGVGHSSIDTIVSITKSLGFHTKLTGAGGGGCVITLLKRDTTDDQLNQLKNKLVESGFESWEATVGDPGVLVSVIPN